MKTSIHPPHDASVDAQLDALTTMTVTQLRARYAEVFGEPTTSGNKQWLYRRVAWRIQALAFGGLSERARQRAAELARDADVRVQAPRTIAPQRPTNASNRVLTLSGKVVVAGRTIMPFPREVFVRSIMFTHWYHHRGQTDRACSVCVRPLL